MAKPVGGLADRFFVTLTVSARPTIRLTAEQKSVVTQAPGIRS
jgi:hypothetical protein